MFTTRNLVLFVLALFVVVSACACGSHSDGDKTTYDLGAAGSVTIDLPDNGCTHAPCQTAPSGGDIITYTK